MITLPLGFLVTSFHWFSDENIVDYNIQLKSEAVGPYTLNIEDVNETVTNSLTLE